MSARDFITVYLSYVDAINRRDVEDTDRLTDVMMAVDCIGHWPGNEPQIGTAGQKAFMREMIANNQDLKFVVDDLRTDEDRLFIRATATLNNPTTGDIETTAVLEIDQIVDGKMVETWTLTGPGAW
jgi:hypothetical protein